MKKLTLAAVAATLLCTSSVQAGEIEKPNPVEVSAYQWMRISSMWVQAANRPYIVPRSEALELCKMFRKVETANQLQHTADTAIAFASYGPVVGMMAAVSKAGPDEIDQRILSSCSDAEIVKTDMVKLY